MAETPTEVEPQEQLQMEEEKLQYLGIVQATAIQTLICFSSLYVFAKERSGPLKPGVQKAEDVIRNAVEPFYGLIKEVTFQVLKFVDRKVDATISEIDRHIPTVARKAYATAQQAPSLARSLSSEVQRTGVIGTATGIVKATVSKYEPTAEELYAKYEPMAEHCAVSTWKCLHKAPLFPQVAQIVIPTAAYWTEKYNGLVSDSRKKGYTVAAYIPCIPTERIAKVFGSGAPKEGSAIEGNTPANE